MKHLSQTEATLLPLPHITYHPPLSVSNLFPSQSIFLFHLSTYLTPPLSFTLYLPIFLPSLLPICLPQILYLPTLLTFHLFFYLSPYLPTRYFAYICTQPPFNQSSLTAIQPVYTTLDAPTANLTPKFVSFFFCSFLDSAVIKPFLSSTYTTVPYHAFTKFSR